MQIDKLVAEVLYFEREVYAARLTTSIKVFLVFGAGALGLLITNQNARRDINSCGGCLQVYVIGWRRIRNRRNEGGYAGPLERKQHIISAIHLACSVIKFILQLIYFNAVHRCNAAKVDFLVETKC
ncbi:Uncharacterised protein [Enterobacter cloacae]|nr:Uncharacterised protein [Enterobacter cloacae]